MTIGSGRAGTLRAAKRRRRRRRASLAPCIGLLALAACGGSPEGDPVRFTVPEGSGFGAVTDTLSSHDIIEWPTVFRLYGRFRGAARAVKPGVYEVQRGIAWDDLLDKLVSGDVVRMRVAVPEGWTLDQIASIIARETGEPADSILGELLSEAAVERYDVPGPTLEGYLYPATYVLPAGASAERLVRLMVGRYKQSWTAARQARTDSIGMSEREVITLASIVEKEARHWGERDTIAAVFRNRLRIGMPLQADPTVQYALGAHQSRLLYAHIDSVADHPYNTYRRRGLPPGPIASPSEGAIDASLNPADVDVLYFVARPDGRHIFTRSLVEHNAARREVSRMRAEQERGSG
ncbi:MAG TPA: endolytic transglycosylase MltG [Longimicrobiaceae bacterium]|nr:endolytic transglycosylase MltG [Longimicrobiaceae bacterium]